MPMTSGANALMKYLAVDYYSIQDDNSDYITSSEYWHNQITYGNKNYKVQNLPPTWDINNSSYSTPYLYSNIDDEPEATMYFPFAPLHATIDYFISNFSVGNDQNCYTIKLDANDTAPSRYDHRGLICDIPSMFYPSDGPSSYCNEDNMDTDCTTWTSDPTYDDLCFGNGPCYCSDCRGTPACMSVNVSC